VEIIKYDTTNVREVDVRTYIRARFRVSFHLALFIATDLIIYCSWRPAATVSTHARRHGGGWRGREAERDASLSSLLALQQLLIDAAVYHSTRRWRWIGDGDTTALLTCLRRHRLTSPAAVTTTRFTSPPQQPGAHNSSLSVSTHRCVKRYHASSLTGAFCIVIYLQIGVSGPRGQGMKRSTSGLRTSKLKV